MQKELKDRRAYREKTGNVVQHAGQRRSRAQRAEHAVAALLARQVEQADARQREQLPAEQDLFVEGGRVGNVAFRPEQRLDDDLLALGRDEHRQVAVFAHDHVETRFRPLDQLDLGLAAAEQLGAAQGLGQRASVPYPGFRHVFLLLQMSRSGSRATQHPLDAGERRGVLRQDPDFLLHQALLAQALAKDTLIMGR